MQTVEENKINYLVFPWVEYTTGSLPSGDKIFILYAYETMANDTGSFTWQSSSVVERDERWRVATTNIQTSGSDSSTELRLEAGTTYQIELWFGLSPKITWSTTSTLWGQTTRKWSDESGEGSLLDTPHIKLNTDRLFVSGTVEPGVKQYISPNEEIIIASGSLENEPKMYISSNEDAVLKIYQG
jgi:hypothetical protein